MNRRTDKRQFHIEPLETRKLLAVTAQWIATDEKLDVSGDNLNNEIRINDDVVGVNTVVKVEYYDGMAWQEVRSGQSITVALCGVAR